MQLTHFESPKIVCQMDVGVVSLSVPEGLGLISVKMCQLERIHLEEFFLLLLLYELSYFISRLMALELS